MVKHEQISSAVRGNGFELPISTSHIVVTCSDLFIPGVGVGRLRSTKQRDIDGAVAVSSNITITRPGKAL
ncbi:hypothetical protein AAHC03_013494 [Spirometra sp. Aus1]